MTDEVMEPITSGAQLRELVRAGIGFIYNDQIVVEGYESAPGKLHRATCSTLARNQSVTRPKRFARDLTTAERWLVTCLGPEGNNWRRCAVCNPVASNKASHASEGTLSIRVTDRFEGAMEAASASLQRLMYGECHTFVARYQADAAKVSGQYDRLARVGVQTVLEFELGGGARALSHWQPPVLTFLDIGGHEIVSRFTSAILRTQLRTARDADGSFWPDSPLTGGFFFSHPDLQHAPYANEADPEWVYFLTDQQRGVVTTIIRAIERTTPANPRRYLVVGGPGTGKTSVLAKLLIELRARGRSPGLAASDGVIKHIESGGAIRLADSILAWKDLLDSERASRFDVALVDDPPNQWTIETAFDEARGRFRAVVVAFDPSQLEDDMTDEDFDLVVRVLDAKPYELREGYRQKENVGRAAKRVMDHVAASTPFLAQEKKETFSKTHEIVYRLSNELRYPNKHGYEQVYQKARPADVIREVKRIRERPLWKHTAPVLLVTQSTSVAAAWPWEQYLRGISFHRVDLSSEEYGDLSSIKGLEYQHAFLVIGRRLFHELNDGFEGSGQARYHRRRLLRIPFTRAKDSMVTFVADDVKVDD